MLAGVVFFGAGVWGAFLLLGPIFDIFSGYVGYFAVPLILVLAPVLFGIAPLYYGITHGWWVPSIVCYGGALIAAGLYYIACLGEGES